MLTITPDALALITAKQSPVFLELPKLIQNCCFDLQECPSVRFGEPRDKEKYKERMIEGATVFIPSRIAGMPLTITLNTFMGFKRLVVEGWNYC